MCLWAGQSRGQQNEPAAGVGKHAFQAAPPFGLIGQILPTAVRCQTGAGHQGYHGQSAWGSQGIHSDWGVSMR